MKRTETRRASSLGSLRDWARPNAAMRRRSGKRRARFMRAGVADGLAEGWMPTAF